jgi:hypothetical protein
VTSLQELARRLTAVERSVSRGVSQPQLAYSSIEDGNVQEYDGDDTLVGIIGKQFDGTHVAASVNGPTPPTPALPIVSSAVGGVTVEWTGFFDPSTTVAPMDFARVDIHTSQSTGFTPDPDVTLKTSFASPRGGRVFVPCPAGTNYVKLVTVTASGKYSVASAEASAATGTAATDGLAPASSPDPEVLQGVEMMYVRWSPITNHDPVTYDVHVSTTIGFTPDSTTKVGETRSSSFTIRALPGAAPIEGEDDPRKLQFGTTYYVRIVARDDDGSAPASLQAVGQIFQMTGVQIQADAITTAHLLAGSITGEKFAATVILGGMFKTAESGQRVEMGVTGIQGYKSDGTLMVNLPTEDDQAALLDAEVIARSLTITDGANFRGASQVEVDGSITLEQGVTPPSSTPQPSTTYLQRLLDTSTLTDAEVTGDLGTFRLVPSEISCSQWDDANNTWVIHQVRPNGTRAWFFDYDGNPDPTFPSAGGNYFTDYTNWEIWSVINITTSTAPKNGVYRMARWIPSGSNNTYYLMCPQGIGFNRYSRLNGVTSPVVGTNGTDVYVAEVVGTQLNIRYFTPNGDGNNISAPTTVYQSTKGFISSVSMAACTYDASGFDTGAAAPRYVVGYRGVNYNNRIVYTSGTNAGSIHPAGVTAGPTSWDSANVSAQSWENAATNQRALAWMPGDGFWTTGGDGYNSQYTDVFWDPAVTSSTVWIQHSFQDNTGTTHESTPGPAVAFTWKRRSKIFLSLPPLPGSGGVDEPDAVKTYAGRGATQPANSAMWLQSNAYPTTSISSLVTSGSNPLTSSTFPNSNPGTIKSADASMIISGDGTITIDGKKVALGVPDIQRFTSSGTWNKPANAVLVHAKAVGGGGAGAGSDTTGTTVGVNSKGSGGAGGSTAEKWYLASDLASSITIGVGGGGVGGTGSTSTAGGNSTFQHTTQLVGAGGQPGNKASAASTPFGAQGGSPGTPTGGDLHKPGGYGQPAWGDGALGISGNGGSSSEGQGGGGRASATAGSSLAGFAGGNYGGGGGGALTTGYNGTSAAAAAAGGNGAPGIVVVTTWCTA